MENGPDKTRFVWFGMFQAYTVILIWLSDVFLTAPTKYFLLNDNTNWILFEMIFTHFNVKMLTWHITDNFSTKLLWNMICSNLQSSWITSYIQHMAFLWKSHMIFDNQIMALFHFDDGKNEKNKKENSCHFKHSKYSKHVDIND